MVVMYADCDQLSALTAMANFGRAGFDNVIVPSASACVTFCLLTEEENRREFPRAIISMTDLFARRFIDNDLLAFSIPWKLYQEMEENVRSMSGNFLDRPAWKPPRRPQIALFSGEGRTPLLPGICWPGLSSNVFLPGEIRG